MPKQRIETYYVGPPEDAAPAAGCVVPGCMAPITAEVHTDCYSRALLLFRGIRRERIQCRRVGDERFFTCQKHLEQDPRMAELEWQWLMF